MSLCNFICDIVSRCHAETSTCFWNVLSTAVYCFSRRYPPILGQLRRFRCLRTVDDARHTPGSLAGIDRGTSSGSAVLRGQVGRSREVGGGAGNREEIRVTINGHFLTDHAGPSSLLARGHAELLVEDHGIGIILVKRILWYQRYPGHFRPVLLRFPRMFSQNRYK